MFKLGYTAPCGSMEGRGGSHQGKVEANLAGFLPRAQSPFPHTPTSARQLCSCLFYILEF